MPGPPPSKRNVSTTQKRLLSSIHSATGFCSCGSAAKTETFNPSAGLIASIALAASANAGDSSDGGSAASSACSDRRRAVAFALPWRSAGHIACRGSRISSWVD